jgi:hypothetical protein
MRRFPGAEKLGAYKLRFQREQNIWRRGYLVLQKDPAVHGVNSWEGITGSNLLEPRAGQQVASSLPKLKVSSIAKSAGPRPTLLENRPERLAKRRVRLRVVPLYDPPVHYMIDMQLLAPFSA